MVATQPTPGQPDPDNPSQTALPTQIDLTFTAGFTGGSQTLSLGTLGTGLPTNVKAVFGGSASVDLDLALGFDFSGAGTIDTTYPSFTAQLVVGGTGSGETPWTFDLGSLDTAAAPSVALNNIEFNFGDFLNGYLASVLGPIASVLKPLEPVLDFLTQPLVVDGTPVLDGDSVLDAILQYFGGDEENVGAFFQFAQAITDFASDLGDNGGALALNFGSVDFNDLDLRLTPGSGGDAVPDANTGYGQLVSDLQGDGDLNFTSQSALDSEADSDSTGVLRAYEQSAKARSAFPSSTIR